MKTFKVDGKELGLEDLYVEIYKNSKRNSKKIEDTFDTVAKLIGDVSSAVTLLPEITKLKQVGVNADEQLIKLAGLIQKATSKVSKDEDTDLSEEELKQLAEIARNHGENMPGGR